MVGDIVHENCFFFLSKKQKLHQKQNRKYMNVGYFAINNVSIEEPHQPKNVVHSEVAGELKIFRFRHSYSNLVFYCAIAFVIIVL